ncbi:MAG: succinate dehydrogenase cytochrome b subunit [Acidobacteria bacterium]|nr:succinate dehydrogenase cytochrome b subunit [Acidobacteriota bacterium]
MSAVATVTPLSSSVAKKAVVALTGLVLYGFVFVHMMGNLQLYAGPEKINAYAKLLKANPPILWGARLFLLVAVSIHIILTIQLALKNKAARPVGYAGQDFQAASFASRTMIWSGPIIGFFILFHLLHLTVGSVHPDFSHTDVYANVVKGFQSAPVAGFYILAMILLGFHLHHGAFSLLQTLGLRFPKYEKQAKLLLGAVTYAIVAMNISFPVAVLAGIVK